MLAGALLVAAKSSSAFDMNPWSNGKQLDRTDPEGRGFLEETRF
jgi:hypothetical protein